MVMESVNGELCHKQGIMLDLKSGALMETLTEISRLVFRLLTKCVYISNFIKGNNWVTEDIFPFITL